MATRGLSADEIKRRAQVAFDKADAKAAKTKAASEKAAKPRKKAVKLA